MRDRNREGVKETETVRGRKRETSRERAKEKE